MAKRYSSCILLFLFYTCIGIAQHSYQLILHTSEAATKVVEKIDYPVSLQDEAELDAALKMLLQECQNQGFYAVSIDSVRQQDSIFHTYLTLETA